VVLFDATVEGRVLRVEVTGQDGTYSVQLDGRTLTVDWHAGADFSSLIVDGRSLEVGLLPREAGYTVLLADETFDVELAEGGLAEASARDPASGGPLRFNAPMPGKIVRVLIEAGQEVSAGQGLIVMEAMKMENELRSPRAGRVRELSVREGQAVETGTLLLVVE